MLQSVSYVAIFVHINDPLEASPPSTHSHRTVATRSFGLQRRVFPIKFNFLQSQDFIFNPTSEGWISPGDLYRGLS